MISRGKLIVSNNKPVDMTIVTLIVELLNRPTMGMTNETDGISG